MPCSGTTCAIIAIAWRRTTSRRWERAARPSKRCWMVAELGGNVAVVALVFGMAAPGLLGYHLLAMACGQCLTAFFAVWTVHHGCTRTGTLARTVRNRFRAMITFSMFFHLEHHLFPQVPTARLHLLARR